jgi:hypothetical protein
MAFMVDDKGNITLVQGDSGKLIVDDLPTDKNYVVYFSFYDENRRIIGEEIQILANYSSSVVLFITASLTDLLKVPITDEMAEYYYGLKICDSETDEEDTLMIEDGDIGDLNTVTVYPKKVEGFIN